MHEKYLKNAWKTLDLIIGVFPGGFQIPPFVPPPFAILGIWALRDRECTEYCGKEYWTNLVQVGHRCFSKQAKHSKTMTNLAKLAFLGPTWSKLVPYTLSHRSDLFSTRVWCIPGFGAENKIALFQEILLISAVLRVQGRFQNPRQTPVRTKLRLKRFPNRTPRTPEQSEANVGRKRSLVVNQHHLWWLLDRLGAHP